MASERPGAFSFAHTTLPFPKWQEAFRKELSRALGLDEIARRGACPLAPERTSRVELEDHVREEFTIETEPGYRLAFYVLTPQTVRLPAPLVITPHGHGRYGKDTYAGIVHGEDDRRSMVEGERDIALQAVRAGYIAIAPDMRGFGATMPREEREQGKSHSCRTMQMRALLFGRTLLGERVWDVMRVLDFAAAHLPVDMRRTAITGNSGGGTVALYAAAVDPRIAVSIPSCSFCALETSWGEIPHCECGYVPGIMNLGNMDDIAGLIAPRPLLIVAGEHDHLAPVESVKEAFTRTQAIYAAAGAADRCRLYVGPGGHRYYAAPVWPFVAEWFLAPGG